MMDNPLQQYSEYRIQDVISRLETFRCSIGWGELNDDLSVAIECLEYLKDSMKEEAATVCESIKPPHWIVDDHGFAGQYYRCSVCGNGTWDLFKGNPDKCEHCQSDMDMDEIEYKE